MERTFYQVYLPHGALVSIQSCPSRQPLPFLLDPLPMLSKSASWQGSSCSEFSHHSLLIPAAHECMSSHWCMSRGSAPERLCTFAPSSIELQGHPNSPGLWRISGKKKVVYELCKSAKKNSDWNQQFWNVDLLETVQGGWKLTHLYLASFISDSVTFLAVGPFLFCGQKALRYSWGWELTYHLTTHCWSYVWYVLKEVESLAISAMSL